MTTLIFSKRVCYRVAESPPVSLTDFIDTVEPSEKTLLLVNRSGPEPLVDLLTRAFEQQTVTVTERQIPEGTDDVVCLVENGTVEAMTPLSTLEEAFLLVNADRYRTGTRQVEIGEFPDVLTGLDEVEFTVRGFPYSNKEKLLLILISRFIEHRALTAEVGEFHSTFQRLSRLDDEYGTRQVYEWLAETAVDTHIYGVNDDPDVAANLDVTVHGGTSEEYRRSWVVTFAPPANMAHAAEVPEPAALVALETDANVWRGMWTYDPIRVKRVQRYLRQVF